MSEDIKLGQYVFNMNTSKMTPIELPEEDAKDRFGGSIIYADRMQVESLLTDKYICGQDPIPYEVERKGLSVMATVVLKRNTNTPVYWKIGELTFWNKLYLCFRFGIRKFIVEQ